MYHRSTKIVAQLEECTQILTLLEPQISQLESEISIMGSVILSVPNAIHHFYAEFAQRKSLGEMTKVLKEKDCCDAQVGPNGQIIACMLHSLQVVNCSTGEVIKKIAYEGFQPYTVQYYKDCVTFIMYEGTRELVEGKHYLVVLDNNFAEMRRWETEKASDMANLHKRNHSV